MNIINLKDICNKQDIVHEYTSTISLNNIPLVIDNGSYQCRAGWSSCKSPLLIFRNLIAKPRRDRKKDPIDLVGPSIQVGNDIANIEAVRFQLKTQFDRNVVTHYHNQEQIFDYIFYHLGLKSEEVSHPIVITEPNGNPNYCRRSMTELLFECYRIPSLCYCIDSLNSYYRNKTAQDGLIISIGFHTVHVIPVLNNKVIASKSRRLNIGGYHVITYLYRLMQLKYPVHLNAITVSRMERLLQNHCYVSNDYMSELKKWSCPDYYEKNILKIQLPYTPTPQTNVLTTEQKLEKKKELAKRLLELKSKQQKEKLVEDEHKYEAMINIKNLRVNNFESFQAALKDNNIKNLKELDKLIENIRSRIERNKNKLTLGTTESTPAAEVKPPTIPQPPQNVSVESWIAAVRHDRLQLLERKHTRKVRRQDLTKRHTVAAQERMKIISQLARKENSSDDFGMRDEDWDVYKLISRDNDSDSDLENEKITEFEEILRHHDPSFEEPIILTGGVKESHQLHVGVELIRAPELLFQPSIIGSPEAGLAEIMNFVFKMFSAEEQLRLSRNVFLTGSCAKFPGLTERLSNELREMRPFQSSYNVTTAESPDLDAWLGGADFAQSSHLKECLMTRNDFNEKGYEYLKEHSRSNFYTASPSISPEITES